MRTPFIYFIILTLFSLPLRAEENVIHQYKKDIIKLNKDIGTYYFVSDSLFNTIEDAEQTRVGSVQDFLINSRGEVEKIVSELNQLDLGVTQLNLDYADLQKGKKSYQLAFKAGEMEEQLAVFLANIETAAGAETDELISARRLKDREIVLPNGEAIGSVAEVITDKETQKIVGVLMENIGTRPDYERFALPYPQGLKIYNTGFSNNLRLSEEFVGVIQDFTAEGIPN